MGGGLTENVPDARAHKVPIERSEKPWSSELKTVLKGKLARISASPGQYTLTTNLTVFE